MNTGMKKQLMAQSLPFIVASLGVVISMVLFTGQVMA
jgi:hypothetical protein